jgi:hypothetical protein
LGGLRLLARHSLLAPELRERLIILLFADVVLIQNLKPDVLMM